MRGDFIDIPLSEEVIVGVVALCLSLICEVDLCVALCLSLICEVDLCLVLCLASKCRGCICWREELCTPICNCPKSSVEVPCVDELVKILLCEGGDVELGARTSKHILVFAFDPLFLTLSYIVH